MIESIEWLRMFMLDNPSFSYLVIFFGIAFLGESLLLVFGFLAAQGVISIFTLVLLSFSGTLFSNTIWFLLGKTVAVARIISHRYADNTISIIMQAIYRASKGSHLGAFIIIKFLFGTPFLLIMYTNKTDLSFKDFIFYEILVIFLWLIIIVPISLASGFGFTYFSGIFRNIYSAIGFVLFFIMSIFIIKLWLQKILTDKKS